MHSRFNCPPEYTRTVGSAGGPQVLQPAGTLPSGRPVARGQRQAGQDRLASSRHSTRRGSSLYRIGKPFRSLYAVRAGARSKSPTSGASNGANQPAPAKKQPWTSTRCMRSIPTPASLNLATNRTCATTTDRPVARHGCTDGGRAQPSDGLHERELTYHPIVAGLFRTVRWRRLHGHARRPATGLRRPFDGGVQSSPCSERRLLTWINPGSKAARGVACGVPGALAALRPAQANIRGEGRVVGAGPSV